MDTLVTEALTRLNHPSPADVLTAARDARVGYTGEVSSGAKRTRAVDADGSIRLNTFLLAIVYVVSDDGIAEPVSGREADFAVMAVLHGEFAHQTRPAGLSAEEREIGFNCSVSPWKGDGTSGRFLSTLYQMRKAYALIADHDKVQMGRLSDIIVCCEALLGDPTPEAAKSAIGVSALFAKRRG